ncbi:MAG TPA: YlbF family regulator [Bacillales bacterium]|nr:YlbF family regulator [Bacillales bacterium]
MLATSERIEILDQVDYLANMILNSDFAAQYRICLYNLKSNKETQRKIRQFVQLKDLYEDVQRFGKYHPDYKRVMKEVRVAKREMDLDPNVAEFKIAENDLQGLLDEISVLIGGAVSENIKVPTGNPFFETSHSCGSGGGCGHH